METKLHNGNKITSLKQNYIMETKKLDNENDNMETDYITFLSIIATNKHNPMLD